MGYTLGMPSLKLSNTTGKGGKHCGNFKKVTEEALKERLGQDLDINHDLTQNNEYLTEIKTAAELQNISETWIRNYNARIDKENIQIEEEIKKAVKEYNDTHEEKLTKVKALKAINDERRANKEEPLQTKRHIRDDAVVMCATIIKPSAAFMSTLNPENQRQMLLDAYDKLKEIVGESNMKAAVIHYDELVPHLHTFWMPETEDGRLCAKEKHNLKFLGTLNKEMPAFLRSKGWDIEDCNAYDAEEEQRKREEMGEEAYKKEKQERRNNQGRSSSKFKHEIQKDIEKLNEKESSLSNSISQKNEELKELESQHENRKTELKKEIEIYEEELLKIQKERLSESQTLAEIHRELDPLKEDLDKYQKLEISSKSCVDLEEKKIPLTQKVAVDITALEFIKSQAKAYRVNRDEVDDIRGRTRELDKREQELNEREQTVQEFNEVCSKEYYRQRNLNKILEQTEEQVKSLKEENQKLKTELNEKNQLIEKLNKTINALKSKVISVYKQFVSAIKAMNMLSYSKEKYKANLTDDQQYLIDGISNYAEKLLRKDKLNELADDVAQHISINNDIQNEMDKLMPHMQHDYDGMCR